MNYTLTLTWALGSWVINATLRPVYPREKTRYLLYRRLGGTQGRFGRVRKISPQMGFDPRTDQPVASLYADCATHVFRVVEFIFCTT